MNLSADALEVILRKMPMGIGVFNPDLTLRQSNTILNDYLETVTGTPRTAVSRGKSITELLPPTIADLRPYLNAALNGQTIHEEVLPLQTTNGTHYWNAYFSSIHENNTINGILLVTTDITRRHRAEEAALHAERALLTLMNNLPGMAYRGPLHQDRGMELVNNGALELTGYAPNQFVMPAAIPYGTLIHADDRELVWDELQKSVLAGRPFALLYRIRTADNQIKWVLEQGSGLFDIGGEMLGIEGFISDITERVLAQQILERRVIDRTQKLSALYEMMAVAAEHDDLKTSLERALSWVLTAVHGEAGLVQLLDTRQTNLHLAVQAGMPEALLEQLETVPPTSGLWGKVLEEERPFAINNANQETDNLPPYTHPDWQTYAGLPISRRGTIMGVLNVWRNNNRPFSESDVALMVAAAEQMGTTIENARLRRENERLLVVDERNRLARELHDAVTQSLYSLTLFAEANQRYAKARDFDNVAQNSQRISETAERSLKEMRLLLHNLRPSILQKAGLGGALQQRLDAVEKRAGIQSRLIYDQQVHLPPHVEETLFHLVEEALNNSLKHAGATAVTVNITQEDTRVTLVIHDNGCGFEPAHLADDGGMGLTSMRERTDLLDGTLTIHSEPGNTTIQVEFDLDTLRETTTSQSLLDLLQEPS